MKSGILKGNTMGAWRVLVLGFLEQYGFLRGFIENTPQVLESFLCALEEVLYFLSH